MLNFILRVLFRRGLESFRGTVDLSEIKILARSAPAAWILVQEKARVDFVQAKDAYLQKGSLVGLGRVLARLLRLQSTNAIIASLLNEHQIERLIQQQKIAGPAAPVDKEPDAKYPDYVGRAA
jgi:hypothetical protein